MPGKSGQIACYSILTVSLLVLAALSALIVLLTRSSNSQTSHIDQVYNHRRQSAKLPLSQTDNSPWTNVRLPNWVSPVHYDLKVHPHIDEGIFDGNVVVTINVKTATNIILIHKYKLDITKTMLMYNTRKIATTKTWYYSENQYWVVELDEDLVVGRNYSLHLDFSGSLTDSIVGFYRSSYNDKDGEKYYLASTKFEPTFARRAFPCFDEPNRKASWSISVVHNHETHPTVLSNMPLRELEENLDGTSTAHFEKTVPMSTYLVCYIISDFVSLTDYSTHGVKISVWTHKDQIEDARFSLDVALKVLDYYDDYFGIRYKEMFPKLDMVAIPNFVSGAMENWGVITYRESRMLTPKGSTSADQYLAVAYVVGHELAHMWFGNIVTMDWWDDLWLNEGFATMISYTLGMKAYNPDWDTNSYYMRKSMLKVLKRDSSSSTHPVIQAIIHPDEIGSAFDTITYHKGSAVLRMLQNYLGHSVFKVAIQEYLQEYKYKNARTDDLWEVMSRVSGQDVKGLMHSWTLQEGLPIISYNSADKSITQKRFVWPGDPKDERTLWKVPVEFIDNKNRRRKTLLKDERFPMRLNMSNNPEWVKLNPDAMGFFRTNYDEKNWLEISAQLQDNPKVLSESDKANLLDDAFNLAAAGQTDYKIVFNLLRYLNKETDHLPWYSTISQLISMHKLLRNTHSDTANLLQEFALSIIEPVMKKMTWEQKESDTDSENVLRSDIIAASCYFGSKDSLKQAEEIFDTWIEDPLHNKVSPIYRYTVYKYGLRSKSDTELDTRWNTVLRRFYNSNGVEEAQLLKTLASVESKEHMTRLLMIAEDNEKVKDQNYWTLFYALSKSPQGLEIAFNWLDNHYDKLADRFGIDDRYLGRAIGIASQFNTQTQLIKLENFISTHKTAGAGKQPREKAMADTKQNIAWLNNYQSTIHNLLLSDA